VNRVRARLSAFALATCLGASVVATAGAPAQALTNPPLPVLTFDHTITSHPFSGGSNASDVEGVAAVSASSMWVADDNSDSVWEIDPGSGAYKSRLRGGTTANPKNLDFSTATEVGSGLTCGQKLDLAVVGDTAANECLSRTDDFESVVYDGSGALYVTSGIAPGQTLAGTPANPTVWKLTDTGSGYKPVSFQQLPQTEDPTAAGWRPGTGLYFGKGTKLKTYNFDTNTLGSPFSIGVSDIVGITFTDASTAFITTARVDTSAGRTTATSDSTIYRFDASSWTRNTPWTFPLANIGGTAATVDDDGMIDARDLAIIGDKFYVSDGYDGRASGDHPIYVYTLGSAPAPTASFTAVPTVGRAPFTVQFLDTSTPAAPAVGAPTSWAWDFGDGSAISTQQHPAHQYTKAGSYTAKLTATNAVGFTSATQKISVSAATALPGGYMLDGYGGLNPFRVGTGPNPGKISGAPYWPGWDIARGLGILSDNSGGYLLDGFGGLNLFRIGSGAQPQAVHGAPYWPGWDIARGVALLPNRTGGYIVDGFGGIHAFAIGSGPTPPAIVGLPYWVGQDLARGITITPDGKGGYMVDRNGVLYPFKIGSGGTKPATPNNVFTTNLVSVHGISLITDGTGGMTNDAYGGLHRFGIGVNAPPPAVSGAPYWPGWDIARDLAFLSD
jgi:PKD repeat protein